MSKRFFDDWIAGYIEYTKNTESSKKFHLWTAISLISAVLQKKVRLRLGMITIYANTYVILVGPPATRKGQAIKYGEKILKETQLVSISADSITKEALGMDIEAARRETVFPDTGESFTHSSLTIISKEFQSFLGHKSENHRMIMFLTDLFDCPEDEWKYKTKGSGDSTLTEPFLSLLAATTPTSLADSMPQAAIGGGLSSRIMLVYEARKSKSVPIPYRTEETEQLHYNLVEDLVQIGNIRGDYVFSKDCEAKFKTWYLDNDNYSVRICKDGLFDYWYERKPLYVCKLAMISSAACTDSRVLKWNHFERAISWIEEVEKTMENAFSAVGKSEISLEVDRALTLIRQQKWITELSLRRLMLRDVDSKKFENVIETMLKSGLVIRQYCGPAPEHKETTWYVHSECFEEWKQKGGCLKKGV